MREDTQIRGFWLIHEDHEDWFLTNNVTFTLFGIIVKTPYTAHGNKLDVGKNFIHLCKIFKKFPSKGQNNTILNVPMYKTDRNVSTQLDISGWLSKNPILIFVPRMFP